MMTGMNDLLAVNRTDSSTVKIEIPENPTVDDVTKVLVDNKVIGEPSYFKLLSMSQSLPMILLRYI